ncbi:MAG TPA: BON domain-containing protein [Polyangiaceae bacterium]|nr:BON domain-containing protein [Polyangiaceae bacterium]
MQRTVFFICTALAVGGCQRSSDRDSSSTSREPSRDTPATTPSANPNPATTTLSNRPAENRPVENRPGDTPSTALNAPASAQEEHAADNTGKNERDRSGATATSGDQGGSEADRRVTQEIRKAVVDDDSLSMTAKNVKIITKDGVVTLRGPVKSSEEKSQIAVVAHRVSGVMRVDNQLEIANK